MKMEQTECSETSAYKIQTPGNYPEENTQHTEHGESLKSRIYRLIYYSKLALHVSGDVFAHHQEHLTVFTVSGSVHPSCCRLASRQQLG